MLDKEAFYWCLASLGAGNQLAYYELRWLVNNLAIHRRCRAVSEDQIKKQFKKLLRYGLLNLDIPTHLPFKLTLPCSKFQITKKGGEALEYYKKMRYYGTKEDYKLGEGETNIYQPYLGKPQDGVSFDKRNKRWRADLNKVGYRIDN